MPRPLQLILKAGIDMSGSTTRRSLIKAALLTPTVPVLAQANLGAQWFGINDAALHALADKVTQAVDPSVWQPAVAKLANQMTDWQATLSLWHQDDVAQGRVVDVHGLVFSQTQLGLLASISLRRGGAA